MATLVINCGNGEKEGRNAKVVTANLFASTVQICFVFVFAYVPYFQKIKVGL
jgi:hypothetical protein